MICETIYRKGGHSWLAFGVDAGRPENIVETNQYVVRCGDAAALLDPGGTEIFAPMLGALTGKLSVDQIDHIFLSHQDPDIGSSLPLWRQVCRPDVQVHISWLWTHFISHFDADASLLPIPDQGGTIRLGSLELQVIPAHFLHSPGNFHIYDPDARVLFSADVGASLLSRSANSSFFVEDFASHTQYMRLWHQRAMGSEKARDAWLARVSQLDIDILAPQHGLLMRGDDVKRFYDWFRTLPLGEVVAA